MIGIVVRTYRLGLIVVLTAMLGACGNSTTTTEPPTSTPTAAAVSVSISPASAAVGSGEPQTTQFNATVNGTTNTAVTWSVNGMAGGNATVGSIGSDGLYTSPAAPTSQAVTVTATSGADPTKSASASLVVVTTGKVTATANPQVAQYSFTSPTDASVTIQFGLDTNYGRQTWSRPVPAGGGTLNMLVAGMKANSTYHMRASVQFANGAQFFDSDQVFTTGGLRADQIPPMTTTTPTSGLSPAGGVEMLNLAVVGAGQIEIGVTDLNGNLLWYFPVPAGLNGGPAKPLADGNMLVNYGGTVYKLAPPEDNVTEEVDLAGNVIKGISMAQLNDELATAGYNLVGTEMHHDVAVLPNGHWIVLLQTLKDFTDLPGYPGTTTVQGDALVDLDQNLQPVWAWNSFDYLDVNRHPFDFPDWTHANAIIYSPTDGDLVLSLRNQSWVIKIDYDNGAGSGDILWRLGAEGDFTLASGDPSDWFYNQHFPNFLTPVSRGLFQLGLYDNGNQRPDPATGLPCQTTGDFVFGGGSCYSRAPILQVNELNKTAQVIWEDQVQGQGFGFCCGNMQLLANGDAEYDLSTSTQFPPYNAEVFEVTHQTTPQTVWEMQMPGTLAYRAFRIPSLYPGVQW